MLYYRRSEDEIATLLLLYAVGWSRRRSMPCSVEQRAFVLLSEAENVFVVVCNGVIAHGHRLPWMPSTAVILVSSVTAAHISSYSISLRKIDGIQRFFFSASKAPAMRPIWNTYFYGLCEFERWKNEVQWPVVYFCCVQESDFVQFSSNKNSPTTLWAADKTAQWNRSKQTCFSIYGSYSSVMSNFLGHFKRAYHTSSFPILD